MPRTQILRAVIALMLATPLSAGAASLYLDPSSGTYGPGDTFILNVRLTTDSTQCINAAQVEVTYPTSTLRAVDFDRGQSIFPLWISDPKIDTDAGTVLFAGGIPGGYCGRIPGDPALSNILGAIVFSVVSSSTRSASIGFAPGTALYKNDGLGTLVVPTVGNAKFTIAAEAQLSDNAWIREVHSDTIPPEPFTVQVESTRGVFDGKYYIVFSTVDKQSGLDHYEIYQNGNWVRVESPYVLPDQSLKQDIQVRAIDKAGNVTLGTYTPGSAPPRQYSLGDIVPPLLALFAMLIVIAGIMFWRHRAGRSDIVDLRP